jgi:predicted transcriptional regulator with HTH domain
LITNYLIPAHPLLQPFVDNYVLSSSNGEKVTLKGPWPASNETSIIFYMADHPYHYTSEQVASPLQHYRGCIVGIQSRCNGIVSFSGIYHTFIIQFKANGFTKLFHMPVATIVNKLYYLDDVFGKEAGILSEALQYAKDGCVLKCMMSYDSYGK